MITYTLAAITHWTRCVAVGILALALTACGGSDNSGQQGVSTLSVTGVASKVAIESGDSLYGLSKISVTGATDESDISLSNISASFNTAQDTPLPLVRDQASPGKFWLPVVLTSTSGTLTVSVPGAASITMRLTLMPFKTADAPGVVTRDFLETSLLNTNAALKDQLAGSPFPDLLEALTSTADLAQQELAWLTSAMQNGTVIMATRGNGTPVSMTIDDLKALDQMVLYTEALRLNRGKAPSVAHLSPWTRIVDFLMPSAFAQTSDSAAFISRTNSIGDALALTASLTPDVAGTGSRAFQRGADAQAASLNMAGLYAAHYGNALATIQALPNLTFTEPKDEVQSAVRALFAGVINEIVLPDLDSLAQDNAVRVLKKFGANVDNIAVESIVMDYVLMFKARS
jgi:hypothetical protein